MPEALQSDAVLSLDPAAATPPPFPRSVLHLQAITLVWKLVECSVSAYAAITAHSPAILAFGSDSVVELISAVVVLSQWSPTRRVPPHRAARLAGGLLFLLIVVILGETAASLALHLHPDNSRAGMAITFASLLIMPILAHRKRAQARRLHNAALAADAAQSATCAYLALLALLGLGLHALFGIAWFDDLAALLALPFLFREARAAWHGHVHSH